MAQPHKKPQKTKKSTTRHQITLKPGNHATQQKKLIKSILVKKEKSTAEILLVWYHDRIFWNRKEKIKRLFQKYSKGYSFKYIYLLFFIDIKALFESNTEIFLVKGEENDSSVGNGLG